MDSEFKRAMKLMWSNKRMRKVFWCDFGLRGNGGWFLAMVLIVAIPLFEMVSDIKLKWFGENYQMGIAVALLIMVEVMMTQSIYGWYGNVGRGFGGFPMAKCIMTKGFLTNLLLYFEVGHLLLLGMRGVCVVLGAVEDRGLDDILFLCGLAFLVQALMQMWFSKAKPLYASGTEGAVHGVVGVSLSSQLFGEINFSIGWAIAWHLIFIVVGSVVYYRFMLARYRARNTVASTEWDATKM